MQGMMRKSERPERSVRERKIQKGDGGIAVEAPADIRYAIC